MTERISIDTKRLRADAEKIEECLKNMDGEIGCLESDLKELSNAWDRREGREGLEDILCSVRELGRALAEIRDICRYESNAAEKFEQCEVKAEKIVEALKV